MAFVTEAAPVLRYDRVTVALISGTPHIVKLGINPVKATNRSTYTVGGIPIANCLMSEAAQADGKLLHLCQITGDSGNLHVIAHDVVANVLTNFTGTVPAGLEFTKGTNGLYTFGPKWHACMLSDCRIAGGWGTQAKPYMYAWAPAKEGGYHFADGNDPRRLMYEDVAGNTSLQWFDVNTTDIPVMLTISN